MVRPRVHPHSAGTLFEIGNLRGTRQQLQPGEDADTVFQASLDATGITNTLHILEGVSAEGREWFEHENRRADGRVARITSALGGISAR